MKKSIFTVIIFFLCNFYVNAQFIFGVEAGICSSVFKKGKVGNPDEIFRYLGFREKVSELTSFNIYPKLGYKFGVNTTYFLKNGVGFETGFYYRNAGSKVKSLQEIYDINSNFDGTTEITYNYSQNIFEIPLMLSYKTKSVKSSKVAFTFSLGAYGNVQSSSFVSMKLPFTDNLNFYNNKAKLQYINEWNWNTLDVGIIAGTGVFINLKNEGAVRLNYHFQRGLISQTEFYNVFNQYNTLSVFYGKIF